MLDSTSRAIISDLIALIQENDRKREKLELKRQEEHEQRKLKHEREQRELKWKQALAEARSNIRVAVNTLNHPTATREPTARVTKVGAELNKKVDTTTSAPQSTVGFSPEEWRHIRQCSEEQLTLKRAECEERERKQQARVELKAREAEQIARCDSEIESLAAHAHGPPIRVAAMPSETPSAALSAPAQPLNTENSVVLGSSLAPRSQGPIMSSSEPTAQLSIQPTGIVSSSCLGSTSPAVQVPETPPDPPVSHHHCVPPVSRSQPACAQPPESAGTLQLMTLTDAMPQLHDASRAELLPQPSSRADAAQHGSELPIEHLPVPVPAAPSYRKLSNVHWAQVIIEPTVIKPLGPCAAVSLPAVYPPNTMVASLLIHIMSAAHRRAKHTHVVYSSLEAIPRMRPSPWPPPQC